jgi:hypothetical protein
MHGTPENATEKRERELRIKQYKHVHSVLNELTIKHSKEYKADDNWLPTDILIITGDATGADNAAADFAVVHYCQSHIFNANWKEFGRRAGPIRNTAMIVEGKPDLVVAFPGGKGTANMVKQAREAGIPVMEVPAE